MTLVGSLIIAFSMYSRIPMPKIAWTEERMGYVMCFFPLVGAVMGVLLWLFGEAAQALKLGWSYQVGGTLLPILVTGGIHLDGFLDVSDARSSYGDQGKKLEILKDPHIGAFAVIRLAVYLLAYLAVFGEFPREKLPVMGAVYVLTRAMSGLSVVAFPKAKRDGLAASFSDRARKRTVMWTMACYMAACLGFLLWREGWLLTVVTAAMSTLLFWRYHRMAKQEFGGITGDLAGWFLQVGELGLMAAAMVVTRIQ